MATESLGFGWTKTFYNRNKPMVTSDVQKECNNQMRSKTHQPLHCIEFGNNGSGSPYDLNYTVYLMDGDHFSIDLQTPTPFSSQPRVREGDVRPFLFLVSHCSLLH